MYHNKIKKIQKEIKKHYPTIMLLVAALFIGALIGPAVLSAPKSNASILDGLKELFQPAAQSPASQPAQQFQPTNSYEQSIVSSVQAAAPAVVSIVISKDVPVIEQCSQNPFTDLPPEFQEFFGGQGFQFSVPCQKGTQKQEVGGGSGFLVSSDGLILTNKHVVEDEKAEYTVLTNDGKKYVATVRARHPSLDIAVLKIQGSNFPTVRLGDSDGMRLGQTAIAIGNALGEFRNTVSVGIVSGLARSVTAQSSNGASETIENVIQTDAAINPGNSGGPLLNSSGEVVGINTAMVSGAQSIGFAIPINVAKKSIQSVQTSGDISVAYLGVRYAIINSAIQEQYDLSVSQGALVIGDGQNFAVEKGSPADKAGIKEGDILIRIDGTTIDENHSPAYTIAQKNPGDTVAVEIMRDDQKLTLTVTLGTRT